MADQKLEKLEVALRNQVGRELYDNTMDSVVFLSILRDLDISQKTPNTRFVKSDDMAGSSVQVDFRTGLPTTTGASPLTGALGDLELAPQSSYNQHSGTMGWSYYHGREDVRLPLLEQMPKNVSKVVDWTKDVAKAIGDSVLVKMSEDLIPAVLPTTSGTGYYTESSIMSLLYPLQSASSGTFSYLGINLADSANLEAQAVISGSSSSDFGVATLSNLRKNILNQLRNKRGAKLDLVLCTGDVYDYAMTQAEAKVVLSNQADAEYGVHEGIMYGGLRWVHEPRLDDLYDAEGKRLLPILDSSTWRFTWKNMGSDSLALKDHETAVFLKKAVWGIGSQFLCLHVRKNGLAYGVTLP